jgi:glycerol kinase
MRNHPELRGLLRRGDAVIATIDAWLVHRLTGGAVFATDSTNASRTLLFDLTRLDWDEDLCRLFEVPPSALPAVRESASRFGETDLAGMLPRRVPICGVMGDSQASLFAQRCFTPGMVKATLGTGSSILLNIGSGWTCAPGGSVATLAWVLDGRPTFALEGIINCSAATIAWLRDQVGLLARSGEAGERAAAVADNGGVYLVPAFAGLGAPHWRPEARGAIVGLTAHTTRNHIIRAAEESIAYQIRDVLEMLRREARIPLQCLRADGGPTRDRFLMQFIADMLRMPVEAADAAGGSALGAAMAGMVGMGWRSGLEGLLELPREATGYAPLMEAEMAERLAAEWAVAVRRVF